VFRAGDVVLVKSRDEEWTLAADERQGDVIRGGGEAEEIALAADCKLIRTASDEARLIALRSSAETGATAGLWARDDLRSGGHAVPVQRQGSLF
jgi:hypothetical protein